MKLIINWNNEINEKEYLYKKNKKDLKKILKAVTNELNLKTKFVVSLNLFNSTKIQGINLQYRNIDKTTDVLSFPQNEEFQGEYDLGDIIINGEILNAQALSINSNENMELKFLFLHGLLHLIGYDHIEKNDEIKMFKKQKEILKITGIRNDKLV